MATQKRNALGRGLDALLSMDDVIPEQHETWSISFPDNPKKKLSQRTLFNCITLQ